VDNNYALKPKATMLDIAKTLCKYAAIQ